MEKAIYTCSGQVEGASCEDFISNGNQSVTITTGETISIKFDLEDRWYDVSLVDFTKESIIKVLEIISGKEVTLIENKETMAM